MLTEIGIKPPSYIIQTVGDDAVISFYENAVEVQREDSTTWQVDEYRMTVRNRTGLNDTIRDNYAVWIDAAKRAEGIVPPPSIPERVTTIEETIDVLFGGAV